MTPDLKAVIERVEAAVAKIHPEWDSVPIYATGVPIGFELGDLRALLDAAKQRCPYLEASDEGIRFCPHLNERLKGGDAHRPDLRPERDNDSGADITAPADAAAGLPLDRTGAREGALTFDAFRKANVTRCLKWHPQGIESWSASDWMTAIVGELGEAASLIKMRNRERDGLPGNKFSPTQKQIADELADVVTYLDLLAAMQGIDLGRAVVEKFNEVSERVGFEDRL